jgi:capsule biosynthesis phosphatase
MGTLCSKNNKNVIMELNKRLVVDLDDTISLTIDGDYINSKPINLTIDLLQRYKREGFYIVINSSRNMRTFETNVGKINIYTLPNIIDWLRKHDVPFDEVYIGKPWCGFEGFYIDDKAIRPSEFHKYSYEELQGLIEKEKNYVRSL